tara:strand:- start:15 stop:176 length:162 start_codon:yes stop_codon:yes gene_type:complete
VTSGCRRQVRDVTTKLKFASRFVESQVSVDPDTKNHEINASDVVNSPFDPLAL